MIFAAIREMKRSRTVKLVVGLLFGSSERDVVSVEAFKAFPATESTESGSSERECLDRAFERSLAAAKTEPGITSLHLVGWCCIRCPGDVAPLSESDIEFHNRRFRRATDVALVLKPKQHASASIDLIELYGRLSSEAAISRQCYRSGSLLVASAERVNVPSDVGMRETVDDDYYLRVFQVLDSLDRAERREGWKRIALRLKAITPARLRPKWMSAPLASVTDTRAGKDADLPEKPKVRASSLPDDSAGPRVSSAVLRTPSTPIKLRRIPSVSLALVVGFALVCAALLWALRSKAPFHRPPAGTPLNLRVEPQAGGSLLVRWDAHSAPVQSARNGDIQIDDGAEHRDLHLDANQIANGSILYTPISKDLTFRLDVVSGQGAPISEFMRVVDGSKVALAPHTVSTARSGKLAAITPQSEEKAGFRQSDAASYAKATPHVMAEKSSSDVRVRPERGARNPFVNASSPVPGPLSDRSGSAVSGLMRPATRKVLESDRSGPGSGNPERPKALQDLRRVHSPVSSSQSAGISKLTPTRYVAPRPLKQVIPSAINLTSADLSRAIDIEVEVRIDDAGRVTEARVVSNRYDYNGLLTSAALAAAKEWIFEPAKMNGKSVTSDHVLKFRFHPQLGSQ